MSWNWEKYCAHEEVFKDSHWGGRQGRGRMFWSRNDGQQKQLKRKWETVGATGSPVSLNALKMLARQLTWMCCPRERQQKVAGRCYKFAWGIHFDPIPDIHGQRPTKISLSHTQCCRAAAVAGACSTWEVHQKQFPQQQPQTYCRSYSTLCQTVHALPSNWI